MTSLATGTYIVSSLLGGDILYLGFSNGAAGTRLIGDNFSGDDSQEWLIAPSTISGFYTFKNQKYQTYVTFNPPAGVEVALISGQNGTNGQWYITQSNSGYIVGIDSSLSLVWNVYSASTSDNTPMILYSFQNSMNEFWKFTPVGTSPSSTASSSTLPSSTATSTPSASCTCAAKQGGLDQGDKIGLAVGLGIGIPTLLVSIVALFTDTPLARYVKNRGRAGSGEESSRLIGS